MNNIVYIYAAMFWFGILLIFFKPTYRLMPKDYLNQIKYDVLNTKILKSVRRAQHRRRKEKLMKELADGLSYLKNITILGRGENISAGLMLEELSDFSPSLSKTYLSMARSLSLNEKNVAADLLYSEIGTEYAKDIGMFLASWEDIPQHELLNSIEAYLNVMREEQLTKQKSKDEMISDLVYFPVVINCMLVLLNFIYVSYFLEQESMLAQMFAF